MTQMVTLPVGGLIVDPNPMVTGRRGALRRADDIILERPGQATSRPALRHQVVKSGQRRPQAIYVWQGNPVVLSRGGPEWTLEYTDGVIEADEFAEPPSTGVNTRFVEARKNLYYTSRAGVRKLAVVDPNGSYSTGLQIRDANLFFFGGTGDGIGRLGGTSALGFGAAYRFCVVSKDVNGYVRRSAPTARYHGYTVLPVDNDAYGISGRFMLEHTWGIGDIVEVYRTKLVTPHTSEPSEEYYLAFEVVLDATHINDGYVQLLDNTPDEMLGAALYTNPSQGGIESANEVPPYAIHLAQFQQCTWFGTTSHRQRWINTFASAGGTRYDGGGEWRTGDGFCLASEDVAAFAVGASTLQVNDARGIVPGMYVSRPVDGGGGNITDMPYEDGTYFQAHTKVVSVSGAGPYTVQIDKPTLAGSGGSPLTDVQFCDWIAIEHEGVTTEFYFLGHTASMVYNPNFRTWGSEAYASGNTYEQDQQALATSFAMVLNRYGLANTDFKVKASLLNGEFGRGSSGAGGLVLESTEMGADPFTVTTSRASAFVRPVNETSRVSDDLARPNRVYYSKPFEPEAVPIGNFIPVGSEQHSIQAMVQAGESLYVFKTDGLYRISGQAPSYWRVDQVSPDVRLVHPDAACAVDSSVAAWTERGVLLVSEGSISSLSDGRINTALEAHLAALDGESPGPAYVVHWPTKNLLLVGVPDATGEQEVQYIYVYNFSAQHWSRWTPRTYCCAYDRVSRELWFGAATAAWDLRRTLMTASGHDAVMAGIQLAPIPYDPEIPGPPPDENAVGVSIAACGFWVPRVGDWLRASYSPPLYAPTWHRIVEVSTSGGLYILVLDVIPEIVPFWGWDEPAIVTYVDAYEGINTAIHWQTHSVTPGKSALYREVQPQVVVFEPGERDGLRMVAGASSDHLAEPDTAEYTSDAKPTTASFTTRFGLSRNVARSTHLYPYFEMGEPGAVWACMGVVLNLDVTSEKSRR